MQVNLLQRSIKVIKFYLRDHPELMLKVSDSQFIKADEMLAEINKGSTTGKQFCRRFAEAAIIWFFTKGETGFDALIATEVELMKLAD